MNPCLPRQGGHSGAVASSWHGTYVPVMRWVVWITIVVFGLAGLSGCAGRRDDIARTVPEFRPMTAASETIWHWPVADGRILSHFGEPRSGRRHAGLDILGRHGQEVIAARAGAVVYSDDSMRGYGKTIILDHGDGIRTLYAHNSSLVAEAGRWVRAGETIARIGRSGNATTEHCHFEVRHEGTPIDPLSFVTPELGASVR